MRNFQKIVGRNVAALRKEKGWTQDLLAQYLEISLTGVQHIENGRVWMSYRTAEKVAVVFNVDIERLYLGDPVTPTVSEALAMISGELGFQPPKPIKRKKPPEIPVESRPIQAVIVEDDDLAREHMVDCLEFLRWKVYAVGDGISALKYIKEHPEVDIVLSDNSMPRLDGVRLMAILAELYPEIIRVFVSGTLDDSQAGLAHLYLPKPFKNDDFINKVGKLVSDKRKGKL